MQFNFLDEMVTELKRATTQLKRALADIPEQWRHRALQEIVDDLTNSQDVPLPQTGKSSYKDKSTVGSRGGKLAPAIVEKMKEFPNGVRPRDMAKALSIPQMIIGTAMCRLRNAGILVSPNHLYFLPQESVNGDQGGPDHAEDADLQVSQDPGLVSREPAKRIQVGDEGDGDSRLPDGAGCGDANETKGVE